MVGADELRVPSGAEGDSVRGATRAGCVASSWVSPVVGEGRRRRGGHERPGTPGQLRTYKLTVRVIAELYPPLTNERRWAFQNAIALSRGRPVIRAAARWDKLDEATVTIECQARDAAAAAEAAGAAIRRTAGLTGQIGVRDIRVARVALAG